MSENQAEADPRGAFGDRPPAGAPPGRQELPKSGGASGSASHSPGNVQPSDAEPEGPRAARPPRQQPPSGT
jgi:hypothetical protein